MECWVNNLFKSCHMTLGTGDLFARDSLKCFHNLQHRHPLACTQVVDLYSMECWVNNLFKSCHMTLGNIHYVNIISASSSIFGVKVASVNKQLIPSPNSYLGDIRHKIIWCSLWVLSNHSRR